MIRAISAVLIWAFLVLVAVVAPAAASGQNHAAHRDGSSVGRIAVTPPLSVPSTAPALETRGHPDEHAGSSRIETRNVHPCGAEGCPGHGGRDHGAAGCDCPAACASLLVPSEAPEIARPSAPVTIVAASVRLRAVDHIPPDPPPRA